MSKVIALNSDQLKKISDVYASQTKVSNADVLKDALGANETQPVETISAQATPESTPTQSVAEQNTSAVPEVSAAPVAESVAAVPVAAPIDMEAAPVNLSGSPVNGSATEQVFGGQLEAEATEPAEQEVTNAFAQPAGQPNMFDFEEPAPNKDAVPSETKEEAPAEAAVSASAVNIFDSAPSNQEEVKPEATPVEVVSNETQPANNEIDQIINDIRNTVDKFSTDLSDKIDNLQEAYKKADAPKTNNAPVEAVGEKTAADLIDNADLDKTVVIPGEVMEEAIQQQEGPRLAA